MRIAREKTPTEVYNLIKKAEIEKDKPYKKWTNIEKLDFLRRIKIKDLTMILNEYETELNNIFLQCRIDEILDQQSLRQRDIKKLKSLGFELAWASDMKQTSYNGLLDETGRKINKGNNEDLFYMDTYFIHKTQAIYVCLEHVLKGNKTYRTDVKGYMEVSKKNCLNELKRKFFSEYLVEEIDIDTYGLSIDKHNYDIALWYSMDDRIKQYKNPLPSYNLLLEIESYENEITNETAKKKYISDMISNMEPYLSKSFDINKEPSKVKKIIY